MTYKINGVELVLQPTYGSWLNRDKLGIDGNGYAIYPMVREYELKWNYLSPTGTSQLQSFFNSISNTGTAVVDLPKFADPTYNFYSYSGCVIRELDIDAYFVENYSNVVLKVTNIRT